MLSVGARQAAGSPGGLGWHCPVGPTRPAQPRPRELWSQSPGPVLELRDADTDSSVFKVDTYNLPFTGQFKNKAVMEMPSFLTKKIH